jgi:hypothetical protein
MAQDEQLDVFGELAVPAPDQQPQQSRKGEIGERKQHLPMLSPPAAKSGTARPRGSAPATTACAADHDLVLARARQT